MTWTLHASGETPAAGGEPEWHALETELVDELRKVLSNPKFAAVTSFFRGKHVASDVHTAVADAETEATEAVETAQAVADAEPAPARAAKKTATKKTTAASAPEQAPDAPDAPEEGAAK